MNSRPSLLTEWATDSRKMLWEYVHACEGLLNAKPSYDTPSEFVLAQLYYNCHLVSESGVILVENRRSWDSQILTRSVAEGTFRFVYLCTKNKAEHEQRVKEFFEDLPNISQIREYEKIKIAFGKMDDKRLKRKMLSNYINKYDGYTNNLSQRYPKPVKQRLSQRWSLSEILVSIVKDGFPEIEKYVDVGLNYSMDSHFVHQDGDAIRALWLRNDPKKQKPMYSEIVVGARILAENLEMAHLRSMAIHYFTEKDPSEVIKIRSKYSDLLLELSKTTEYATQHLQNRSST